LYLCVPVSESRKNQFSHFLKSWESLGYKESYCHCCLSRTCISICVLWKSLESSFGTNSRFGHRSKKNMLAIGLGILDDCKCSENFLAPAITTLIWLSATFSIQVVDGLQAASVKLTRTE
jgi:hypothetical protein